MRSYIGGKEKEAPGLGPGYIDITCKPSLLDPYFTLSGKVKRLLIWEGRGGKGLYRRQGKRGAWVRTRIY